MNLKNEAIVLKMYMFLSWRYGAMIQHMPRMCEALNLIASATFLPVIIL